MCANQSSLTEMSGTVSVNVKCGPCSFDRTGLHATAATVLLFGTSEFDEVLAALDARYDTRFLPGVSAYCEHCGKCTWLYSATHNDANSQLVHAYMQGQQQVAIGRAMQNAGIGRPRP